MLKNILNLKGAKTLNKKEQQHINGGGSCVDICTSHWTQGDPCVRTDCQPGRCGQVLGGGYECVIDPS